MTAPSDLHGLILPIVMDGRRNNTAANVTTEAIVSVFERLSARTDTGGEGQEEQDALAYLQALAESGELPGADPVDRRTAQSIRTIIKALGRHYMASVERARADAKAVLLTPTARTDTGGEMVHGWRCFHCGDVFHDERCARLHFGRDEDSAPACQIKAGAEQGLLAALREAEYEAADARRAIADESTEAARAHYAQATRHDRALRNAEEAGYERGLADGRSLAAAAAPATADTGKVRRASEELTALANIIERPPLDDVTLEQSVALRAAAAIRVVIAALRSTPQQGER